MAAFSDDCPRNQNGIARNSIRWILVAMEPAAAKRLAKEAWERSIIPGEIHVYLEWCWQDGDVASQNQLFRLIRKRILGLVASYELALAAAKEDPSVATKIAFCLEKMRSLEMPEYGSWFLTPDTSCFQGKAPRDWFIASGHKALAESLVHKNSSGQQPRNGCDVPLPPPDSFETGETDPLQLALSVQSAIANANLPDEWLRRALANYHPRKHPISRQARRDLMPIYRSLVAEAERLLTIFGDSREKDEFDVSGVFSTAALLCLRRLFRRGPASFAAWYLWPQPEFAGLSPNTWFVRSDCHSLAVLFQMFIPGFGCDGKQWVFVGDFGQASPETELSKIKCHNG